MASRKDIGLYIPDEQTATILFTKKGDIDPETGEAAEVTVMWMEVKADLTFDDRQRLFWNEEELPQRRDEAGELVFDKNGKPVRDPRPDEEVWDVLAPFVLDWSVGQKDAKGKAVKVPPPAEAGGEQFGLINPTYVAKLLSDLRFRSSGKVSTDFLAR